METDDLIFTAPESWKMTETQKVVAIIRAIECWRLGNWDGCCCSRFSIRGVDVEISCGKADEAIRVSSRSYNYDKLDDLKPIMAEIVRQVSEQSGRGENFAQYLSKE